MKINIVCYTGRGAGKIFNAGNIATCIAAYAAYQAQKAANEQAKSNEIQQEALDFQINESKIKKQNEILQQENQNLKEEISFVKSQEKNIDSNIKVNSENNLDNGNINGDIQENNIYSFLIEVKNYILNNDFNTILKYFNELNLSVSEWYGVSIFLSLFVIVFSEARILLYFSNNILLSKLQIKLKYPNIYEFIKFYRYISLFSVGLCVVFINLSLINLFMIGISLLGI